MPGGRGAPGKTAPPSTNSISVKRGKRGQQVVGGEQAAWLGTRLGFGSVGEQATCLEVVVLLEPPKVAPASHQVVGRARLGTPYWRPVLVGVGLVGVDRTRRHLANLPARGCRAACGAAGGIASRQHVATRWGRGRVAAAAHPFARLVHLPRIRRARARALPFGAHSPCWIRMDPRVWRGHDPHCMHFCGALEVGMRIRPDFCLNWLSHKGHG